MKKFRIVLAFFCILAALAAPAGATPVVLNFDDLPSGEGGIPNQEYPGGSGIFWGPSWAHSDANYGDAYASFSGNIHLYTTPAGGWVKWPGTVTFLGTAYSTGDQNQSFQLVGYLGGSKVFETTPIAGAYRDLINVSWNVDEVRLVLSTPNGIIDNWTYENHAAVPVPPSLLLFGTGMGGLCAWRKLRRRKSA